MRTVVVRNGARILLGKQGENKAVRVTWSGIVEQYTKLYGDGRFELVVVQKGQAYPAVVRVAGTDLVWDVLSADVATMGAGSLELIYYVGDTVAKSQTWETFVVASKSAEGTTEPPDPAKNWVDTVLKSSSDAKQAATESAESAKQAAASREAIENMEASAISLPPNSKATVEKDLVDGKVKLTFGIPRGESDIFWLNTVSFSRIAETFDEIVAAYKAGKSIWVRDTHSFDPNVGTASALLVTPLQNESDIYALYIICGGSAYGSSAIGALDALMNATYYILASPDGITFQLKISVSAEMADRHSPNESQLNGSAGDSTYASPVDHIHPAPFPDWTNNIGKALFVNNANETPSEAFEWRDMSPLIVNITKDGKDTFGDPVYKSDKTFDEIKAAYDTGREIKLREIGDFSSDLFQYYCGTEPKLISVSDNSVEFIGNGNTTALLNNALNFVSQYGGLPTLFISIEIIKTEKGDVVEVSSSFTADRENNQIVFEPEAITMLSPGSANLIPVAKTENGLECEIADETVLSMMSGWLEGINDPTKPIPYSPTQVLLLGHRNTLVGVYNLCDVDLREISNESILSATFVNAVGGVSFIQMSYYSNKAHWDYYDYPFDFSLLKVDATDNGNILRVVDGKWQKVKLDGSDLSLGITGATVGQTIKVKAINADGKPTAWEAVDVTGDETWEKIAEIDFDVDAANDVSVWEYKNLPNYKELLYRKVSLVGSTETASGLTVSINNSDPHSSGIAYAKKDAQYSGWGKILVFPFGWVHVCSPNAVLSNNQGIGGLQAMYNPIPFDGDSITSVKLSAHARYKIAGGKLSLYGRR